MQSIQTKYFGASNSHGSKIKAIPSGVGNKASVTISYEHDFSAEKNHDLAAIALCKKLGWEGEMVRGGSPDGKGYVYVFNYESERILVMNTKECNHCNKDIVPRARVVSVCDECLSKFK